MTKLERDILKTMQGSTFIWHSARKLSYETGLTVKHGDWFIFNVRPVSIALQRLKRKGLVVYSRPLGFWQLTDAGKAWKEEACDDQRDSTHRTGRR